MSVKQVTTAMGFQGITDLSAATGLTPPAGAQLALIVPVVQGVYWRDDGADPTASTGGGMFLPANVPFSYDGNLLGIKFIQATAGAWIGVSYYI